MFHGTALAALLKHSKHSMSGGSDRTNNYLLHLAPERMKTSFHVILNNHLGSPMPDHWLPSHTQLLYEPGDPYQATHYRPNSTQYTNLWPPSHVVTYSNKPLLTPYLPPFNMGASAATSAQTIYATSRAYTLAQIPVTHCTSASISPLSPFHCPRYGQYSNIQTSLAPPSPRQKTFMHLLWTVQYSTGSVPTLMSRPMASAKAVLCLPFFSSCT